MKIKNLIIVILILTLSSFSFKKRVKPEFNFQKWRSELFTELGSITEEKVALPGMSKYKKDIESDTSRIKSIINSVDQIEFAKMLDTVFKRNEIRNWKKMYYIFQFQEGEVMSANSTFVFYSSNNSWSIGYSHNNDGGPYPVGKTLESSFNLIKSSFGVYETNFFFVSEFDSNLKCLNNKVIICGPEDIEKFQALKELNPINR